MGQIATLRGVTRLERAIEVVTMYTDKPIATTLSADTGNKRLDGNTTRQVNFAIEMLYRGHVVVCQDHKDNGEDDSANMGLFERVLRRLRHEHPGMLDDKYIGYNYLYKFIYLKT